MQIEVCVPANTADNFIAKFRPIYFSPGYTQFPGMLFQVTIVAVNLSFDARRPRWVVKKHIFFSAFRNGQSNLDIRSMRKR